MTMTRFLVVLGLIIAAIAVYVIVSDTTTVPMPATAPGGETEQSQRLTFTSDKYGISFSYPATYELSEINTGSGQREQHSIVLQRSVDLPAPEGGEGPPSITIDIYQNDLDSQTTEDWIRNTSQSNFKLGDMTLRPTTIDGKAALSYRWSGLYEGTTIAIAQPDWVYAFNVMYLEMGDDIVQDFVAVRESVRLQ